MKKSEVRARMAVEAKKTTDLFDKLSLRDTRDLLRILKKVGGAGRRHLGSIPANILDIAFSFKLNRRAIARGLADAKAGRLTSLDEVIREIESKNKK